MKGSARVHRQHIFDSLRPPVFPPQPLVGHILRCLLVTRQWVGEDAVPHCDGSARRAPNLSALRAEPAPSAGLSVLENSSDH